MVSDDVMQVRIAAAQQLPELGRVLGCAAAVTQVVPELVELLTDDEVQVGCSAGATTAAAAAAAAV
jgi:hypothetical protein